MVREGNVRVDVSLPSALERQVKAALVSRNLAKKGAFSRAVEEGLHLWLTHAAGCSVDVEQGCVRGDTGVGSAVEEWVARNIKERST